MQIDVVTLFPQMFESPFAESMMRRAKDKGILDLRLHQMRKWAWNNYGAVDDRPYGGDVGMLIRADVMAKCLTELNGHFLSKKRINKKERVILTSARGKRYTQKKAEELSKMEKITILCGHYEGFDQRVGDYMADEEISIGDYVLTGGELAAMVIIDSVIRLQKGVLGKDESSKNESFSEIIVEGQKIRTPEYPQYTRPADLEGYKVPEDLLSGDPKKIKVWQTDKQIKKQ